MARIFFVDWARPNDLQVPELVIFASDIAEHIVRNPWTDRQQNHVPDLPAHISIYMGSTIHIPGIGDVESMVQPFTLNFQEPIVFFLNIWVTLVYGLYILFKSFPIVFKGVWSEFGLTPFGILVGILTVLSAYLLYCVLSAGETVQHSWWDKKVGWFLLFLEYFVI